MSNTPSSSPRPSPVEAPSEVPSPVEAPSPSKVPLPVEAPSKVPSPSNPDVPFTPSFSPAPFYPALITPSSSNYTSSTHIESGSENIIIVILLVVLACLCTNFFCRKRLRKSAEYHNIDPFEVEEDLVGVVTHRVQDKDIEINEIFTDDFKEDDHV